MASSIFIGLDVGTSSCKALAIDENAKLLGSAAIEYPCYSPKPGWSEQSPEDWWNAACAALQALCTKINPQAVAGIGLSGQMHGMVALDAEQRVLRRAILWNDQRTEAQCQAITQAAGGTAGLLSKTNNPMLTGFTGGKIVWFRENEPELFARTQTILNPKDYINAQLTGELATEVSDASGTGLFDVEHGTWSTALLADLQLDPSLFAKAHASTDVIGTVHAEAAARTGLPVGTPVVGGGGDAVLSAVGMGVSGASQVAVTLGTSGVVARHVPTFFANHGAKLQFSRACLPGLFHVMGVTLAAAGSNQWLESVLGDQRLDARKDRYRALDAEALQSPAGANGVLFAPYLSGERCPVNDSEVTGAFVGLRASTTRGDLTRAVLEGVAFSLRQVYDIMCAATSAAEQVILAGGGAVSPVWRQIVADVFNLPIVTLEAGEEGGGFGAAILAGLGTHHWASASDVLSGLKEKTHTEPHASQVSAYQTGYARYAALYPALATLK